jgi:hypothetical protein
VTIAFATCATHPGFDDDDLPLVLALTARGVDVEPVIWDAPHVNWSRFAAVVVRNTWDYHRHRPRFLAWAERVDAQTMLVNSLAALRWNTHKRYLRDLEARGVRIVPTAWIDAHAPSDLRRVLVARGWTQEGLRLVVKPAVSAGAEQTLLFGLDALASAQATLNTILAQGDALVQPYLESVESYGERSLVFFGGHFSHAIRKCPSLGGDPSDKPERGLERAVTPTDAELLFAASVLHAAAELAPPPVFARVDIAHGGSPGLVDLPALMELEMVEPTLFFRTLSPTSAPADRLAELLAELVAR